MELDVSTEKSKCSEISQILFVELIGGTDLGYDTHPGLATRYPNPHTCGATENETSTRILRSAVVESNRVVVI